MIIIINYYLLLIPCQCMIYHTHTHTHTYIHTYTHTYIHTQNTHTHTHTHTQPGGWWNKRVDKLALFIENAYNSGEACSGYEFAVRMPCV